MKLFLLSVCLLLPFAAPAQKNRKGPQQREVKVQKTSLSRDDEIKLGNDAAADVERTMDVIKSPEVEAWLNQIGGQLARTPQANAYPYHFKLLNDDSINAFALPGGPMFVHTGLIKAAEDESQVAGVLAHEMSHVALRHGANQMSKAQVWGTIMGVAGAAAGVAGGGNCGLWCQAAQMGGGLVGNSVLLKFSRDHERDADLNGARMMAAAGYNPIELANFFEKLIAKGSSNSGFAAKLQNFMSDHPDPGNRVQYVSEDIQFYPKQNYTSSTGTFDRVKQVVAGLPPPRKKPAALLQPVKAQARTNLPQGFKDLPLQGFAVACPSDWQAGQTQSGGTVFLAPQDGIAKQPNGGVELILGGMIDYYQPQNGKLDLQQSTTELLDTLKKGDQNLRAESPSRVQVGGKPALLTRLTTKTSNQQEPDQVVYLYTVAREAGLWNLALAAPPSKLNDVQAVFQQIAQTVQFPD